ncbi:hypothetical protein DAEQUDRAFT_189802 [Daedalea quercina L-15889]|uniref:Uncharacterized protein n=1 Tax=Daedalea quercina L-15889 TaxID=1314783 RepID=A0A165U3W6_9APHY|nr:hypothetical protein DAEQUDRAFT_189802 [Daedalea quercina L-15889]
MRRTTYFRTLIILMTVVFSGVKLRIYALGSLVCAYTDCQYVYTVQMTRGSFRSANAGCRQQWLLDGFLAKFLGRECARASRVSHSPNPVRFQGCTDSHEVKLAK